MKKTILIIIVVFSCIILRAQVVLDKTFNLDVEWIKHFPSENGIRFYGVNSVHPNLTIYNYDYSVYKSFPYTVPPNSGEFNIEFMSDKLFNDDALLEFILVSVPNFENYFVLQLCNENNILLYNFGSGIKYWEMLQCNGSSKFIIRREIMVLGVPVLVAEIYSLPGSYPQSVSYNGSYDNHLPYPNPTHSTITLSYKLKLNETSNMHIYNSNGLLIEQKTIDSRFDKILLNVENYKPGVYFYEVNGVSQKFEVTK